MIARVWRVLTLAGWLPVRICPLCTAGSDHTWWPGRQARQLRGHRRVGTFVALRLLFRFAKQRRLVFVDPTRRLYAGSAIAPPRVLLPMTRAQIDAVERVAVTPAQRLAVALQRCTPATRRSPSSPSGDVDLAVRRTRLASQHADVGVRTPPAGRLAGASPAQLAAHPNRHVFSRSLADCWGARLVGLLRSAGEADRDGYLPAWPAR